MVNCPSPRKLRPQQPTHPVRAGHLLLERRPARRRPRSRAAAGLRLTLDADEHLALTPSSSKRPSCPALMAMLSSPRSTKPSPSDWCFRLETIGSAWARGAGSESFVSGGVCESCRGLGKWSVDEPTARRLSRPIADPGPRRARTSAGGRRLPPVALSLSLASEGTAGRPRSSAGSRRISVTRLPCGKTFGPATQFGRGGIAKRRHPCLGGPALHRCRLIEDCHQMDRLVSPPQRGLTEHQAQQQRRQQLEQERSGDGRMFSPCPARFCRVSDMTTNANRPQPAAETADVHVTYKDRRHRQQCLHDFSGIREAHVEEPVLRS